ncbi:MobF family relaxase [Acidocella aromatica]|uniref:Conjugative relaxase-like TrwC/TraI family protein n=1 Tax=Acidocella aromatica TaxID=1303579 RepID=A0A840VD34_9PROT|nr:MobF family relaxase [Acidocella aromatica]MBB5373788.1 conjugative relaxase-like TrwC/TraI family protein [Acidocella aromatica]
MVATISALTSAAQAASYYEADDYYAEGGLAPSEWFGQGARALRLAGAVDRERFAQLLIGHVSDQELGTMRDGEWEHRPGWDMTFSAPKSVSIMAEVAGDRRLIAAHERAVRTALELAEQHFATTRIREDGSVRREATGNLVIASFRHGTSRALDPQLHSHNIILNMTRDEAGQWRSLEPRAFYQMQKQMGAIYRQELASEVQRLGYAIERGRDSTFEIAGIGEETLEAFSQRSAAIEARLAERGKSRAEASAAEKQIAALDTRLAKEAVPHAELIGEWREAANAAGWDEQARRRLIAKAEARAEVFALGADQEFARELAADRALAQGAAMLGERQSVFSTTALHEAAGRFGMGRIGHDDIAAAIARAEKIGALEARECLDRRGVAFEGFTTAANIANETTMLRLEEQARQQVEPILSPVAAARAVAEAERRSAMRGHEWTDEQRAGTAQILASPNRVVGLQGAAGTAKTSTVLATIAREAEARGIQVTAIAPTASAAQVLGEALDSRADTLARHLLAPGRPTPKERLWIVDEASLISTADAAKLLALAESHRARVLLVGDTAQLGSVEAGAAFAQLQGAGMETARLTKILRQTNEQARAAVEASLAGDAKKALAALDAGGGRIIEHDTRKARFAQIAQDYAKLDTKERRKALVIEPSREGRDELTKEIRHRLAENGALHGPAVETTRLVPRDLTRAEAKDAHSYVIGDMIRFAKDYADKGVSKAQAYRVVGIDTKKAAVMLAGRDDRTIDWRLRQWGASHAQAFTTEAIELRAGDQVQFTRNDRALGRINGQQGEIIAVDPATREAKVRVARGKIETLTLDSPRDQHIAHAYVATAFAAQGRTAERTFIHADSAATHLIDQKSFYVAVSRAKETTAIYTNDRAKLVGAIAERIGAKQVALAEWATPGQSVASANRTEKHEKTAKLSNGMML